MCANWGIEAFQIHQLSTFWAFPGCSCRDAAPLKTLQMFFMWVNHLWTSTDASTCCYCRDAALLKTMQIALASLKQLQTSTDTKLKEQVGSLRVLFLHVVPLGGCLGDLLNEIQGSVLLHAATQQPYDLAVLDCVHAGYPVFLAAGDVLSLA